MAILNDKSRTAGFLIRDDLYTSREEGNLVATAAMLPGSLLSKTAVQGIAAAKIGTQTVGNGTVSAGPAIVAASKSGEYTARFTSATAFDVIDPTGATAGSGTAGTAYATGISFTITAGSAPFVAGDTFIITADVTKFNYVPATAANAVAGILFEGVPDAGTYKRTAIARNAEVQSSGLVFGTINQGAVIAQLNTVGIAVRIH